MGREVSTWGQFYGEISVHFFFVFSAGKLLVLCLFGAFVSTSREREECFIFERSRDSFLKKFLLLFFLVVVAVLFFRRKKTSRAAF